MNPLAKVQPEGLVGSDKHKMEDRENGGELFSFTPGWKRNKAVILYSWLTAFAPAGSPAAFVVVELWVFVSLDVLDSECGLRRRVF